LQRPRGDEREDNGRRHEGCREPAVLRKGALCRSRTVGRAGLRWGRNGDGDQGCVDIPDRQTLCLRQDDEVGNRGGRCDLLSATLGGQEHRREEFGRHLGGLDVLVGAFCPHCRRPNHHDPRLRSPSFRGEHRDRAGFDIEYHDVGVGGEDDTFEILGVTALPYNIDALGFEDQAQGAWGVRGRLANHHPHVSRARRTFRQMSYSPRSCLVSKSPSMVRVSACHTGKLKGGTSTNMSRLWP
jgi:hypothetical protein